MTQASINHGISRGLTLLFAIAGGAAVANLYYAQPLLDEIGRSLHTRAGSVGLLVTVTQLGYASGVFLVVPLGDTVNRRKLIPAIMACSAVALIAAALAPTFVTLLIALAAVGLTSVTGQLLTPLAGDLANDGQRGRVVGTVVSGLLTGILVSRTISGLVADAFGWRAIFLAAFHRHAAPGCVPGASHPDGSRAARRLLYGAAGVGLRNRATAPRRSGHALARCGRIRGVHDVLDSPDI